MSTSPFLNFETPCRLPTSRLPTGEPNGWPTCRLSWEMWSWSGWDLFFLGEEFTKQSLLGCLVGVKNSRNQTFLFPMKSCFFSVTSWKVGVGNPRSINPGFSFKLPARPLKTPAFPAVQILPLERNDCIQKDV